jgi:hypothetical protein
VEHSPAGATSLAQVAHALPSLPEASYGVEVESSRDGDCEARVPFSESELSWGWCAPCQRHHDAPFCEPTAEPAEEDEDEAA